MSVTLKIWNAGEAVLHTDLNSNFAAVSSSTASWQTLSSASAATSNLVVFSLPGSGYLKFRAEWTGLQVPTGTFFARVGTSGTSPDSGAHYSYSGTETASSSSATTYYGNASTNFWELSSSAGNVTHDGFLELEPTNWAQWANTAFGSGSFIRTQASGGYTLGAALSVLVFGFTGGSPFTAGQIRLSGWTS